MRFAPLALVLAGCATVGVGILMTKAPPDVPFCDGAPRAVDSELAKNSVNMPGVEDCTRLLFRGGLSLSSGQIDFVLSVDANGEVTDVCVEGGTLGNVPDYVSCLATKAKQGRGLPTGRYPWTLKYEND